MNLCFDNVSEFTTARAPQLLPHATAYPSFVMLDISRETAYNKSHCDTFPIDPHARLKCCAMLKADIPNDRLRLEDRSMPPDCNRRYRPSTPSAIIPAVLLSDLYAGYNDFHCRISSGHVIAMGVPEHVSHPSSPFRLYCSILICVMMFLIPRSAHSQHSLPADNYDTIAPPAFYDYIIQYNMIYTQHCLYDLVLEDSTIIQIPDAHNIDTCTYIYNYATDSASGCDEIQIISLSRTPSKYIVNDVLHVGGYRFNRCTRNDTVHISCSDSVLLTKSDITFIKYLYNPIPLLLAYRNSITSGIDDITRWRLDGCCRMTDILKSFCVFMQYDTAYYVDNDSSTRCEACMICDVPFQYDNNIYCSRHANGYSTHGWYNMRITADPNDTMVVDIYVTGIQQLTNTSCFPGAEMNIVGTDAVHCRIFVID
jgi:hypothetical protein